MRLGINGWRMVGRPTGVGRYIYNIVSQWDAKCVGQRFNDVTIYSHKPLDADQKPLPSSIQQKVIAPDWRMLLWENLRLGPTVADDVVYHPSFSRPLWQRGRSVVVIHEIIHEIYPHLFPRSVQLFYSRLYRLSARQATLVICGVEESRQDIARHIGIPLDKIRVVPMAPAGFFRQPCSPEFIAETCKELVGEDMPYFLFVGKLSGRRSIPLLLNGFAQFKQRTNLSHKLVVVGLNIHNLDLAGSLAELGITDDVIYPGYVSDEVLKALYQGAVALVSPTLYEPISLPVMEAQAAGTTVIATDSAGMRDTMGGFGMLLQKPSPETMADAMEELASNPARQAELARDGQVYSQQFSWRRTAELTLDVLAEAAQR